MSRFIDAARFRRPTSVSFPFGLDVAAVAGELRRIADAVEHHDLLPRTVHVVQLARMDDFHVTRLVLEFSERVAEEERAPEGPP